MPKVYLDEIDALLTSGTMDTLTVDSSEATTVSEAITSFIGGSQTQLAGQSWDDYRAKLQTINEAMQVRIALAKKLGEAIQKALQLLKDYLGDDLYLDSDKLDLYRKQKQNCENSIAKLNSMLSATTQVEYKDESGVTRTKSVALYDASEIRAQIATAEETLRELDRLITKIEGLDAVYAEAEAILAEAFSGIDGFKNQVSDIMPDRTVSYKPA